MSYPRLLKLPQYFRNIQRLSEIIGVLIKYGFRDLVDRLQLTLYIDISLELLGRSVLMNDRPKQSLTLTHRIRLACIELGPTFIKLGQQISMRPDIFPAPVINELRKLQDEFPPFPADKAISIIESELKKPISEIFFEFNRNPIGSASISQVHEAILHNGKKVVVKIQRPDLIRTIQTDTEILLGLATLLEERIPESVTIQPVAIVEEFTRILSKELDFNLERKNQDISLENLGDNKYIKIPRTFPEFSSKRILTQEMISGVSLNGFDLEDNVAHPINVVSNEIVKELGEFIFKSIFEYGIFHGDPHPGNIKVIPDGSIGILDYGAMGRLSPSRRLQIIKFLIAVLSKDAPNVIRSLRNNRVLSKRFDEIKLENQLSEILDYHHGKTLRELNLAKLFAEVFDVTRRYDLVLPSDLLSVIKTLTSYHYVGWKLCPNFDPYESLQPYIVKKYKDNIKLLSLKASKLKNVSEDYLKLAIETPNDLRYIASNLAREEFTIYSKDRDNERNIKHQNRLFNRVIIGASGLTFITLGINYAQTNGLDSSIRLILLIVGVVLCISTWRAVNKSDGLS